MKHTHFLQTLGQGADFRSLFALTALALAPNLALAGNEAPAAAAETPELKNWIGVTGGGMAVGGNDAALMRRHGLNGDFYGGIDSFHFEQEAGDDLRFMVEGHALMGLDDYEIEALIEKDNLGFIRAGYRQFTTWYDGSGGYFPPGPFRWVNNPDELSLDRGEFFFEAGLRMEDIPEITFSYRHLFRDGQKDSTSWGEVPFAPGWNNWRMAPSLWDIDEEKDIFELDITHTLGNTDLGAGFRVESSSYDNAQFERRGSNPALNTTASPRTVTRVERYESDLFSSHFFSETRFNDRVWLTAAYMFTTVDTDLGGSRNHSVIANSRDYNYNNTTGGGQIEQHVANLNLMWNPIPDLTVVPSLRAEWEDVDSWSGFVASVPTVAPAGANVVTWKGNQLLSANTDLFETTEALEIRYTGIQDLVLYAEGEWAQEDETIARRDMMLPGEWMRTNSTIHEEEYTLGANWYPISGLSFSLQGFHESREQSLDQFAGNQSKFVPGAAVANNPANRLISAGPGGANNLRPLMYGHNSEADDLNLRVTWRPLSNLTLVTRYDYRVTEYENRGVIWDPASVAAAAPNATPVYLPQVESGSITSHVFSESATWSPNGRLYLQGSLSYVVDDTKTPSGYIFNPYVAPNDDNGYFNGNVAVGYLIDDKTDVQAGYYYYSASNYINNSAFTMPYGEDAEEHALTLTLTRWLSDNMVWNIRYSYLKGTDAASGGWNDYDAHVVSTGLQYRF